MNATPRMDDISIPSGAIKSIMKINNVTGYFDISIPSGAIKSGITDAANISHNQFQFLLVRLREANEVTIDYGNINFNSFWCD